MYKYFINYILLLSSVIAVSQEKILDSITTTPIEIIQNDSINPNYHPKTYGLRVGFDISKPVIAFIEDDFIGGEVVADYRINTRLFVAGELGYTQRTIEEDYFTHTSNGTYLKLGVNYNLFTNWLDMDNETYLGARYGTSLFSNELDSYTIAQYGTYFDPKTVTNADKFNNLTAHWLEFVAGLKVEVLKNLYLGFMINFSKILYTNDPDNFKNTYSPGFGKINSSGVGSNFNYTIAYRIPLYKK